MREVKNPVVTRRINQALSELPAGAGLDDIFGRLCLKWNVVEAKSRTAVVCRTFVERYEFWADGFFQGSGGQELFIVTGSLFHEGGTRTLVALVDNVDRFVDSLRAICCVAKVQLS